MSSTALSTSACGGSARATARRWRPHAARPEAAAIAAAPAGGPAGCSSTTLAAGGTPCASASLSSRTLTRDRHADADAGEQRDRGIEPLERTEPLRRRRDLLVERAPAGAASRRTKAASARSAPRRTRDVDWRLARDRGEQRVDRGLQIGHRLEALRRLLREAAQHQRIERRRAARAVAGSAPAAGSRRCAAISSPTPSPSNGGRPGEHVEQHAAERVDVGAVIDSPRAAALLGRHVDRRAEHHAGLGRRARRRRRRACRCRSRASSCARRRAPRGRGRGRCSRA